MIQHINVNKVLTFTAQYLKNKKDEKMKFSISSEINKVIVVTVNS